MRLALIIAATAGLAMPALAQQGEMPKAPVAACAAIDAALPADLADWNSKAPLSTATGEADIAKASISLGKGYEASLLNTQKITFPVQPEKPGGSVAHAGLFEFTVGTAGAYSVALGAAAWIDVLENGKSVEPTKFGQGPECTSIRKIVVFPLQSGKHALQVSAIADAKLKILVAKKP